MKRIRELLLLAVSMMKIGLFTFGGGYAMISVLEHEFVTRRADLSRDEFLDMTVIAESTPGPIAINAATYIGYRRAGFIGAVVCTVAMCLPSFAVIYLISLFFDAFLALEYVKYAFLGIRVAVVYLIFSAGIKMIRSMKRKTPFAITLISLTSVTFVLLSLFAVKVSSIVFILIGGALGIVAYLLGVIKAGEGKK